MPQRSAGFTLIEMMVVLVVLGLAVGLIVARGPARSARLETESAARSLMLALRQARSEAIATDRPIMMTADPGGRSYHVGASSRVILPPTLTMAIIAPVVEQAGRRQGVLFMPDGSATGEAIMIRRPPVEAYRVGVDWLTGRVTLTNCSVAHGC